MKIELSVLKGEIERKGRREIFLSLSLRDVLSFLNHSGYGIINLEPKVGHIDEEPYVRN